VIRIDSKVYHPEPKAMIRKYIMYSTKN